MPGMTRTVYEEYIGIVDGYSQSQKSHSFDYYILITKSKLHKTLWIRKTYIFLSKIFKWNRRDSSFFVQDEEKNLKIYKQRRKKFLSLSSLNAIQETTLNNKNISLPFSLLKKIIFNINIERNKLSDCTINSLDTKYKDFCHWLYLQGGLYMEGKIHIYVLRRQLSFTVLHRGWGAAVSKALSAARKTAGITAAHPVYPFSLIRHGRRGISNECGRKGIGNRSQSCDDDRERELSVFFFFLSQFLIEISFARTSKDVILRRIIILSQIDTQRYTSLLFINFILASNLYQVWREGKGIRIFKARL